MLAYPIFTGRLLLSKGLPFQDKASSIHSISTLFFPSNPILLYPPHRFPYLLRTPSPENPKQSRRIPFMAAATSGIHIRFPLWSTNCGTTTTSRRSPFLFSLGLKTLKSSHAMTQSRLSLSRNMGRLGNRNSRSVVVRCEAPKDGTVLSIYLSIYLFLAHCHACIAWISSFCLVHCFHGYISDFSMIWWKICSKVSIFISLFGGGGVSGFCNCVSDLVSANVSVLW